MLKEEDELVSELVVLTQAEVVGAALLVAW